MNSSYTIIGADWLNMAISPIQFFSTAHTRAEGFLGLDSKGRTPDDDLRAAVVFSVSAVDAYFHAKIIRHLRERQQKEGRFAMSPAAQEMILGEVSKSLTGSEYRDLPNDKKKLIDLACAASDPSLITHLEEALKKKSFQGIGDMSKAMEIMGKNPQEIWGKFDSSTKLKIVKKKNPKGGRPLKPKFGKKIDAKVQLERLFNRRQAIIHNADTSLKGKWAGKPTGISGPVVKRWLKSSEETIKRIDKLIA